MSKALRRSMQAENTCFICFIFFVIDYRVESKEMVRGPTLLFKSNLILAYHIFSSINLTSLFNITLLKSLPKLDVTEIPL